MQEAGQAPERASDAGTPGMVLPSLGIRAERGSPGPYSSGALQHWAALRNGFER